MSAVLLGRDLHKSFGFPPALRGASLMVNQGGVLAVMGPSGSGKSTLLHCLAGVLTPDSGEVIFDDRRHPPALKIHQTRRQGQHPLSAVLTERRLTQAKSAEVELLINVL